jgi:hypothetical protein
MPSASRALEGYLNHSPLSSTRAGVLLGIRHLSRGFCRLGSLSSVDIGFQCLEQIELLRRRVCVGAVNGSHGASHCHKMIELGLCFLVFATKHALLAVSTEALLPECTLLVPVRRLDRCHALFDLVVDSPARSASMTRKTRWCRTLS